MVVVVVKYSYKYIVGSVFLNKYNKIIENWRKNYEKIYENVSMYFNDS